MAVLGVRLVGELERSAGLAGRGQYRGLELECVALGLVLAAAERTLREPGRAALDEIARAAELCLGRHVPAGSVALGLVRPALDRMKAETRDKSRAVTFPLAFDS